MMLQELKEAIDQTPVQQQKKRGSQSEGRPQVTEAKGHINEE